MLSLGLSLRTDPNFSILPCVVMSRFKFYIIKISDCAICDGFSGFLREFLPDMV